VVPGSSPPLPPVELAARVGTVEGWDAHEAYLREGAALRARLERFLPPEWTFDGKRVLDFGCGSARVLRHFLEEAEQAEFWGCDIDGPSIDWVSANLCPPLHCFQNGLAPPLPLQDGYLNLVWATSVFTHIDLWSDWLLEMHRVLAPGGLLIASFLGEGMWEALVGESFREDEVGMAVLGHWKEGGAGSWVFHSEWWLREHWGRAFEILEVARPPRTADGSPQVTHSYIAMRKRPGTFTSGQLERCDPGEPRELAGAQTNVRLLRGEIAGLVKEATPEPDTLSSLRRAVLGSPLGGRAGRVRERLRRAR
jgi:SAM-dependent methyltransferase